MSGLVNPNSMVGQLSGQRPTLDDVLDAPNVKCPKCGCSVFVEGMVIKKISGLLTQSGKDTISPIPVYYCSKCGEVLKDYFEGDMGDRLLGGKKSTLETK